MINAEEIRAFGDELRQIIKHAALIREAKTAGALGKLRLGGIRPTPVPKVGLPAMKVV